MVKTQQFKSEVFLPVAIQKVVLNRSDILGSTKPSRERKRSGNELFELLD